MIKFLLAPLFISCFLISTQVQAETVSGKTEVKKTKAHKAKHKSHKAAKPKVQKQKVAIIKTKPAPQKVTVNFEHKPSPSLKKNAMVLGPSSAVKKSKVRAEIRSLASVENKTPSKKKFWSMRCKDGYISGSKVFCSVEKNAPVAKFTKKAKAQRAVANAAATTAQKR